MTHSGGGGPGRELLRGPSRPWLPHGAERQRCPSRSPGTRELTPAVPWHTEKIYILFAALTKNKKIGITLILTSDGYCWAGCCHVFMRQPQGTAGRAADPTASAGFEGACGRQR